MSPPASPVAGLVVLLAVVAYLGLLLPRLRFWSAVGVTLAASLMMLLLVAFPTELGTTLPTIGLAALLAGHAGWLLGRHARSVVNAARRLQGRMGPVRRRPRRPAPTRAAPLPEIDILPVPVPHQGTGAHIAAQPPEPLPEPAVAPDHGRSPPAPGGPALALSDLDRTSLGRYRIDRAIGRGSMGVVYLGMDPMLGRQVAIKTMALGREFAGAELADARRRFFREAETAGRLQHRDIVTIYDVGEEEDLAYIAMEFLKGHDLQRHTHVRQLLPLPVTLRVCSRVADALAYAHSQGVIHRDIKPANVMLHPPSGAVKVTDFGIARITDATRTRTGMVLGTPSFMSPEHLAGQAVDGRSDLYALGVMLFQLLTGQLPFRADSMAKLMYQIANEPAPDLRTVLPDLPDALATLVAQALQKNPAHRPADGVVMAAQLRAIGAVMAGESTGADRMASPPGTASDSVSEADGAFAQTVRFKPDQTGHNSGS